MSTSMSSPALTTLEKAPKKSESRKLKIGKLVSIYKQVSSSNSYISRHSQATEVFNNGVLQERERVGEEVE